MRGAGTRTSLTSRLRLQTGLLGTVLLAYGVVVLLLVFAVVIDITRMRSVRSQLQNAVDAAALAAAPDLYKDTNVARERALTVAKAYYIEGVSLSSSNKGNKVDVDFIAGEPEHPPLVRIKATRQLSYLFGSLIGRTEDKVTAIAVAGTVGPTQCIAKDQLFPLAVSVDALPVDFARAEMPLWKKDFGKRITLFVNGQQVRNAAFTTFDRNPNDHSYLRRAMARILGSDGNVDQESESVPAIQVGDRIFLNQSITGQTYLTRFTERLVKGAPITLPVIAGDPQAAGQAKVYAFVSLDVTAFSTNRRTGVVETLDARILKGIICGRSGDPLSTGIREIDQSVSHLSTGTTKLLPINSFQRI